MDIFSFLDEEQTHVESELKQVLENFSVWPREKVFEKVKDVCSGIANHITREKTLLLDNLVSTGASSSKTELGKDAAELNEEVGRLVEVHIDEPEYDKLLRNLLTKVEQHHSLSKRAYDNIKQNADSTEVDAINAQFQNAVFTSSETMMEQGISQS